MSNNKIDIKNIRYYQIINCHYKYSLYITSGSEDFQNEKAYLEQPNQKSLGQVWQIIEVDPNGWKKGMYEIVHTRSTLVLTRLTNQFFLKKLVNKTEDNQVKLRYGNWGANQLFYLQQINPDDFPNIFRFSSSFDRSHYLIYDNYLRVQKVDPTEKKCHWQLKPCYDNQIINRSCYLQNAFSTLSMDVPGGSKKKGCELIQWGLNNRFNQRFNIFKAGAYYKISNLNSKLFLSTSKKPEAEEKIKQQQGLDELQQMWILEYQGKNLYLIRSAQNVNLLLGIRDHSIKQDTPIILTTNQEFALWKIIGFIPR